MATRRKFLRLMGVGATSAPLAAKELTEGAIAKQAGIDLTRYISSGADLRGVGHDASDGATSSKTPKNAWEEVAKYMAQHNGNLPEHVEEAMRDEANNVNYLDYDIANKRSWSMAVKVQEQRQRNYQRQLNRYKFGSKSRLADQAFKAVTGFDWPWY